MICRRPKSKKENTTNENRKFGAFARLAAAASLVAAPFAAPVALAADVRIIVVSHGQQNDPFWSIVKNGVDAAARDTGVDVQYRAPATFDMPEMAKLIDNAVASKPDGLVVSFPDSSALGKSVQNAVRRGIPVISMNSAATNITNTESPPCRPNRIRSRTRRRAQNESGRRHQSVVRQSRSRNVALDLRCEGFAKGMGGGVEVVDTGGNDPSNVRAAVSAKLKANPDINGILTLGPLSALPSLGVLKSGNMLGKVKLASFDLAPDTLKAVRDGQMLFLIDQQPFLQGYLPVAMLAQEANYAVIPAGVVMTGPGFVTKENAAKVIELSAKGFR